jgi:hypothetical protein
MRKLLLIILSVALLLCSGCSIVSVGYNNADWILRYRINDYTSFNEWQKEEIRREIDTYSRWHRNNALPEYVVLLQNLDMVVQQDGLLKTGEVVRIKGEIGRLYRRTMQPFVRPSARILSTLNSRQIEELEKTLSDRTRKQKKEIFYGSEQKNLAMRAERYIALVEKLAGNLSGEQEGKITEMSLHIPFATRHYLENREANQAGLIALLNNKAGEEKIAEFLLLWINNPEATRTAQQQQVIQAYENGMIDLTVRIYQLLTARQKTHLREKIRSYIEDFQSLRATASTTSATPG